MKIKYIINYYLLVLVMIRNFQIKIINIVIAIEVVHNVT